MRLRGCVAVLQLALLAGACGTAVDDPASARPRPRPIAADSAPNAGVRPDAGAPRAEDLEPYAECVPEDAFACPIDLTRWTEPTGRAELVAAECSHQGFSEVLPACHCTVRVTPNNGVSAAAEGPVEGGPFDIVLYPGNRPGSCSEYLRTPGCLYCGTEFPGCNVNDSGSCDAVCADMARRYDGELQKTFAATSRVARCGSQGRCEYVTELDGQCYARAPVQGELPHFSCTWSDEEILAHQAERYAGYCPGRPDVACATASDCPRGLACGDAGMCVSCGSSCLDDEGRPLTCAGQPRCAEGEFCVDSACVPADNIECVSFGQCEPGQACLLTGMDLTGAGRGNENTHAVCRPFPG